MSFCRNCGKELKGTEKFCASCGSPVSEKKEQPVAEQKKADNAGGKKKVGIIVAAVVVAIAVIVAIVFALNSGKKEKEYNNYIASAEKYLEENEYEQAIAAYLEAIEVDEKKLKPYVEVAEIYIEQKEYVKAKDILEQAEENDAQGTEEEEKEQEELAVFVLDIVDNMVLDKEQAEDIIWPLLTWLYFQDEGFDDLTMTQKVEVCAMLAYENNWESYDEYEEYRYYSKEEISELMVECFGEEADYEQVEDTQFISELNNEIELLWPETDFERGFSCDVDEIKQQEDGSYVVKVTYNVGGYMILGQYEYFKASYVLRYDHTLENEFYIDSMSLENVYKGDDYVYEQDAVYLEIMRKNVVDHYTEIWKPEGKYVSFEYDDVADWGSVSFTLRYQMTEREAEEKIANGGFPAANIYVTTVDIDLETGKVTEEWGDTWTMELPWE